MRKRFSAMWSDALGKAIKELAPEHCPYDMSLVGEDRRACILAVNQGIDSRLEACNIPDRGDRFTDSGSRLACVVSAESLPVLIRRLLEDGDECGMSLASGICDTLGIELI
jgi:hypothetical protein